MTSNLSLLNHRGSCNDGGIFFGKFFQNVLNELFAKIPRGIPRQFIGQISQCHYIDGAGQIWRSSQMLYFINPVYRIFDNRISEIAGNRTTYIVSNIGNGLNPELR